MEDAGSITKRSIILVEDDEDDIQLFTNALAEAGIKAPLQVFKNGHDTINYLQKAEVSPYIIFCDLMQSVYDGIDLRKKLSDDPKLHNMSIPFIFITQDITEKQAKEAFKLPVQGLFLKPTAFNVFVENLAMIVKYWCWSATPNSLNPPIEWEGL